MYRLRAIIEAVRAALAPLEPGIHVSTGRVYPVGLEQLPAINIRAGDDVPDPDQNQGGPQYKNQVRQFDVDFEVWASAESDIDAAAFDVMLEIERVLGADPGVEGLTDDFRYFGSGEPERTAELESPLIARVITYRAWYRVDVNEPT